MAKFCGHCGTQMDDDALVCGQCGVAIDGGNNNNEQGAPKKKKRLKRIIIPVIIIILGIFIFRFVQNHIGIKGVVRKTMHHVQKLDVDELVTMSSHFYDYANDENEAYEHYENFIEDDLGMQGLMDDKYKLSYKISKITKLSKAQQNKMLEYMERNIENDISFDVEKMAVARLSVRVVNLSSDAPRGHANRISILLSKENGAWRILGLFGKTGVPLLDYAS